MTLLGWAIFHSVWQGAIIGAVAALALAGLRRAAASTRYAVASGALLALPAASGLTMLQVLGLPVGPFLTAPFARILPVLIPIAPWVAAAWVVGVIVASLRLAGGWMCIGRLRVQSTAADAHWQRVVDSLAARSGIRLVVRLAETAVVDVPCVVGWLSPMILFPIGALSGLHPAQIELIITHELAHIRRNDYLMNAIQTIVETMFFYHPIARWLSRRIRLERELCCDDLVAESGDRLLYATALAAVERLRGFERPHPSIAAGGGDLLSRVQRLLDEPVRPSSRVPAPVVGFVTFVPVLGIAAMVGAPSAALAADVAMPTTFWLGALLGVALGLRHALEPDHLLAVSTLMADERDMLRSARLGASWGLGHTMTLVIVATGLALIRGTMPDELHSGFEIAVAVMLIGLGIRAIRSAWRLGTTGPVNIHAHGLLIHQHRGGSDHVHVGPWAVARRPLIVGMIHGLAGSGALAALAMTSLPSLSAQVAYIFVFGLGSMLGMSLLSGIAGWPLARLSRRPATLAWISGATGIASLVLGVFWGAPFVWNIL